MGSNFKLIRGGFPEKMTFEQRHEGKNERHRYQDKSFQAKLGGSLEEDVGAVFDEQGGGQ